MKNIVIFADGEWGEATPDSVPSNIDRMARFTESFDEYDNHQIVHYIAAAQPAVTQSSLELDLLGAYRFLVLNYIPGDRIFLFGFSYGAYLMRLLSGLIDVCGVLQRHHLVEAERGLALFWQLQMEQSNSAAKLFRSHFALLEETSIHFVGLFDCVGECGIPDRFLGNFKAHTLCNDPAAASAVRKGALALALDENRKDHIETKWFELDGTVINSVWFHGSHQQLGGLEQDHDGAGRLGDIALGWMVQQASAEGLEFGAGLHADLQPNKLGQIQDFEDPLAFCIGRHSRCLLPNHHVHQSVQMRSNQMEHNHQGLHEFVENMGWQIAT